MIKLLRNKAIQKKLFLGIAVMIIPSFLIWAVKIDKQGANMGPVAGTFQGHKIPTGEFLKNFQSFRREIYLMQGSKADELMKQVDMEKAVWDRVLLGREARRLGVRVSNAEVVDWIGNQSIFQPSGVFEPFVYKRFVEYQLRMTAREFEEDIRQFLAIRKTVDAVAGDPKFTEDDARRVFREQKAPRRLRYVLVTAAPGTEEKPVPEEEIRNLYNMLQAAFMKPESAKISYAILEKGSGRDTPENRKAVEAEGLEKAAALGLEIKTAGPLGPKDPVPEIGFSEALSAAVFKLETTGDRTPWIETDKGAVLVRLDGKEASRPLSFEEARADIEEKMRESQKQESLRGEADRIRAAMVQKGFDPAAAEEKLEVLETKNYKPGEYLDKVGQSDELEHRISPLAAGELSEPVPYSGGFAIVRVVSVDETFTEGWAGEKDRILAELADHARSEAISKKLEELRSQLNPNFKTMGTLFPQKYSAGLGEPLETSSVPDDAPQS